MVHILALPLHTFKDIYTERIHVTYFFGLNTKDSTCSTWTWPLYMYILKQTYSTHKFKRKMYMNQVPFPYTDVLVSGQNLALEAKILYWTGTCVQCLTNMWVSHVTNMWVSHVWDPHFSEILYGNHMLMRHWVHVSVSQDTYSPHNW